MALLPHLDPVDPDHYLADEDAAEFRSEYYDGVVVAMSGGTPRHSLLAVNTAAALRNALAGSGCRVFGSDLKITVPRRKRYVYPDVQVICGPLITARGHRDVVTHPTLVVEVLSASTESRDRGVKFLSDQSIPSLQEYVLVAQDEPRVELFQRTPTGAWLYSVVEEGSVGLESLQVALPLERLYEGWAELESTAEDP